MRVTEGAANPPRDIKLPSFTMVVTNLAKTPGASTERCKAVGGETKAEKVSSGVREAP